MKPRPVLLFGLDAADLGRIERLCAAGKTPGFARMLSNGTCGRLRSRPVGLSATIWPKWFEGGRVGSWYFPKQWNPERMRLEWITATRGEPEPFWCDLDRRGLRTCIVDVPQAPRLPMRHGLALQGWQVHDLFDRWSEPAGLFRELARAHRAPHLRAENYGPQNVDSLLALRAQLLAASTQAGDVAADLIRRGPHDLFVMILGTLHRGGHYLWDTSQVTFGGRRREDAQLLEEALDEIYVAADRSFVRVVERAPAGTRVLLFALHGMQANGGWAERFQAIAGAVGNAENAPRPPTFLQRMRQSPPGRLAQRALGLVPERVSGRLLEFTSARMHDWQRTPWFVLPSDLAGFLRLNVQGREAPGLLAPGRESRAVEDRLIEQFAAMTDLEGRRIAADIERVNDIVAADDPFRYLLPDLLINWGSVRAGETSGLRLDGRDIIRWDPGMPNDSGRCGNHATEGWFAATGPGLEPGRDTTLHDIDGLVPTLYGWLGLEPPARFGGVPLARLQC